MVWENVGKKNMTDLKIDWILFHVHLAVDWLRKVETFPAKCIYIRMQRAIFRNEICNDKYWVTSRQKNNFTNWKIPICLISFTYLHVFRKPGLKIQMGFDCSFLHRMNVFKQFFWHADYIIIKKLTCSDFCSNYLSLHLHTLEVSLWNKYLNIIYISP